MSQSSYEPTDDLARDAGRSTRSFAALYERVAPALFAWAALRVRQPLARQVSPEDLMQESWLRAASHFDRFDPEKGSFRAWIFTIATRVLLDAARRSARRGDATPASLSAAEIPDEATRASLRVARDERLSKFIDQVRSLSSEERTLVISCGLEGVPPAELSQRLGVDYETLRKRWQRLRARLRESADAEDLLLE